MNFFFLFKEEKLADTFNILDLRNIYDVCFE